MSRPTPGPWEVVEIDGYVWIAGAGGDVPVICNLVARDFDPTGAYADEDFANAALIAAAPALLEALEMVRDADEDCKRDGLPTLPGPARKRIDAALAKARGES